jgi:MFS family permease
MSWSHAQIGFINVFVGAAGTTFLVGYFRHIGFTEYQVAVYGSVIGFACFFCVFGAWFAQRTGRYKKAVMRFFSIAILCFVCGVFSGAAGEGGKYTPIIVLSLIAGYQLFINMPIPVLLSWLNTNVGQDNWQKFFSTRMISGDCFLLVTIIIVGRVLGENPVTERFLAVFIVAALFGLCAVYSVSRIPEPSVSEKFPELRIYFGMIFAALRQPPIRKLIITAFIRSFAYGFIMPFQPMFLLEVLKFDYSRISYLICLGSIFSIVFYKIWAYFQKKYGDFRSLKWNLLLSIFEPFLWFSATQANPVSVYLAFALFGFFGAQGMINAGFWPSFLSAGFSLSDERLKPIYTALYYLVFGAATIIAPLVSGTIIERFKGLTPLLVGNTGIALDGFRIIFLISALLLMITTIYASFGRRVEKIDLEKEEV